MLIVQILIGIPGSGKSTYAVWKSQEKNWEWISSDSIRKELTGSEEDQTINSKVFNLMYQRTIAALGLGHHVIYDATNLSSKNRMNFIKQVKSKFPKTYFIATVFAVPYEICCTRNLERERTVPQYVMDRMLKNFTVPAQAEGFDKIEVIGNDETEVNLQKKLEIARKIPHDNPHHQLTIGEHMNKAYWEYWNSTDLPHRWDIGMALQFHDIGKQFCKVFTDAKGLPTEIAHYYGHENAGAYFILSAAPALREQEYLYVALLVNHHMDFFKSEKYLNKIRSLYGEDFYRDLEIIHHFDEAAH